MTRHGVKFYPSTIKVVMGKSTIKVVMGKSTIKVVMGKAEGQGRVRRPPPHPPYLHPQPQVHPTTCPPPPPCVPPFSTPPPYRHRSAEVSYCVSEHVQSLTSTQKQAQDFVNIDSFDF